MQVEEIKYNYMNASDYSLDDVEDDVEDEDEVDEDEDEEEDDEETGDNAEN